MNCDEWLRVAAQQLGAAEIPTARLDALVLLEDALAVDRAQLLAHPDMDIPSATLNVLTKQLKRRAKHEPLAYVRGRVEFYGREFLVTPDVLVPRPESETMIERLVRYVKEDSSRRWTDNSAELAIVDVGTGSGALAITAAIELPAAEVFGVDIDPKCLAVAKRNAKLHDVKITLAPSNLLDSPLLVVNPKSLILLCNLPYVPDAHTVNSAASHEPKLAIFGGPDGLDLYRKLFKQIDTLKNKPLLILTESLPPQHTALQALALKHGYQQDAEDDFIQAFVHTT